MKESKNITYLLGAGASYNSIPILKDLGARMLVMAQMYLDQRAYSNRNWKPKISTNPIENMLNLGYWGELSKNYGTIDTIAKYLYLNNSEELKCLKFAVSMFFTIWETVKENSLRMRVIDQPEFGMYSEIDERYISLLAALLPDDNTSSFQLNKNVKFVTWNYDLQLQRAFKLFRPSYEDFETATSNLKYKLTDSNPNPDICHLNGYAGYYHLPNNPLVKEHHFLERHSSNDLLNIVENLTKALGESLDTGEIIIDGHINYAWESEGLNRSNLQSAKQIFGQTDTLVIIGYSFPNFNKRVDKMLFDNLALDKSVRIYYQDPNEDITIINELARAKNFTYTPIKQTDRFFLPYDF